MTNEEVRNRIQNAELWSTCTWWSPYMVKKRKLRWYGHITRSAGMAKTILQGTVQGSRRGRQKKRWEDTINEWTDMEFGDSLRVPCVVPRRPPSLRDWDEMSLCPELWSFRLRMKGIIYLLNVYLYMFSSYCVYYLVPLDFLKYFYYNKSCFLSFFSTQYTFLVFENVLCQRRSFGSTKYIKRQRSGADAIEFHILP